MDATKTVVQIGGATLDDVVASLLGCGVGAVVACGNVGDAAAAVTLHRRSGVRQIGQAADYRHDVSLAARPIGAACVAGYYWQGEWEYEVSGPERVLDRIDDTVRGRVRSRQADAAAARRQAEAAAREEDYQSRRAAAVQLDLDAPRLVRAAMEAHGVTGGVRAHVRPLGDAITVTLYDRPKGWGVDRWRSADFSSDGRLVAVATNDFAQS